MRYSWQYRGVPSHQQWFLLKNSCEDLLSMCKVFYFLHSKPKNKFENHLLVNICVRPFAIKGRNPWCEKVVMNANVNQCTFPYLCLTFPSSKYVLILNVMQFYIMLYSKYFLTDNWVELLRHSCNICSLRHFVCQTGQWSASAVYIKIINFKNSFKYEIPAVQVMDDIR